MSGKVSSQILLLFCRQDEKNLELTPFGNEVMPPCTPRSPVTQGAKILAPIIIIYYYHWLAVLVFS